MNLAHEPLQVDEQWRPIPGFEGSYEVSDIGRVRSMARISHRGQRLQGRIIKACANNQGYLNLCLSRGGRSRNYKVHRLVTLAFLGPCPLGYEVNHRNSIRSDARLANLEYVTRSDNQRHALRFGFSTMPRPDRRGESNGHAKLRQCEAEEILRLSGLLDYRLIGKMFRVNRFTVRDIAHGRSWTHLRKAA